MDTRAQQIQAHPEFPFLREGDVDGVSALLRRLGWLAAGERVLRCDRAGEGNMNLTLRVETERGARILKQARPWVEKYPDIPAPWERGLLEARFYARVSTLSGVEALMPQLLGSDADARVLLLQDLAPASDLASLYAGDALSEHELVTLSGYLRALHAGTRGAPDPALANREMRALNHAHIFQLPLSGELDLDLEAFEPGLAAAADALRADARLRAEVERVGERYLADGPSLLHGDFFPGSWLRTAGGVRVIDPEFCFCGPPEFDAGVAVAHLALAGQPPATARGFLADAGAFDTAWVGRFAAVEVVRRLLGVAQLPLAPSRGRRAALLDRARRALLDASPEPLLEAAP